MNDAEVYGKVICNIPAPTLVEQGYILPPKVVVKQLDMVQDKQMIADRDCQNLIETIDENSLDKILIAARSTKQIIKLLSQSDFRNQSWQNVVIPVCILHPRLVLSSMVRKSIVRYSLIL